MPSMLFKYLFLIVTMVNSMARITLILSFFLQLLILRSEKKLSYILITYLILILEILTLISCLQPLP
jgi:hypothetical protein